MQTPRQIRGSGELGRAEAAAEKTKPAAPSEPWPSSGLPAAADCWGQAEVPPLGAGGQQGLEGDGYGVTLAAASFLEPSVHGHGVQSLQLPGDTPLPLGPAGTPWL